MMRMLANKKNVKVISVFIAAIFILGVAGLAYMQMNTPSMAAPSSNIGVVDKGQIMQQPSELVKSANEIMQAYGKSLEDEFNKKAASLNDQQKQMLLMELQQKQQMKGLALQKEIDSKINDAAKSVADTKGLTVVLEKSAVLYGGVDITPMVAKKVGSEKLTGAVADTANADAVKKDAAQKPAETKEAPKKEEKK